MNAMAARTVRVNDFVVDHSPHRATSHAVALRRI